MIVKRIFNNNVVLAKDDEGKELMLLGNGIGFSAKLDERIEESKVEKVFILKNSTQLTDIVLTISEEILLLAKNIIELAETELETKFNSMTYVGLADHISYAIERAKEHEFLPNAMIWEIRKFYSNEFIVALTALKMINDRFDILLSEDEAGFIAIHFVNGQKISDNSISNDLSTTVIKDILNIVKIHFKTEFSETSINYNRFITHLRYYIDRTRSEETMISTDRELFMQVKDKYPNSYQCVKKIKNYISKTLNNEMSIDEQLYLMLHINRLTNRKK